MILLLLQLLSLLFIDTNSNTINDMSDNDNESDTIIRSKLAYHHDTTSTINSKSHITLMTIVMMMMMLLMMTTTTIPTVFTTGVMSLILGNTDFSNNIIVTMSIIMSILNNYSADVQDIL